MSTAMATRENDDSQTATGSLMLAAAAGGSLRQRAQCAFRRADLAAAPRQE